MHAELESSQAPATELRLSFRVLGRTLPPVRAALAGAQVPAACRSI